jgi:hypothetical protein
MSKETEVLRQLELAQAKIKAVLLDPEWENMSSKILMAALMCVAAEIALANEAPEAARNCMIEIINHGFSNLEYPVVQ